MIGVVFSYFRSALVFVLSFLCCVAGVIAICVHTPYSYLRVLEIIGVVIIFLALCEAADLCAFGILDKETYRVAYIDCDPERMRVKLGKLVRRAYLGDQKAVLLLMYAQMQIYCGKYREALISVSDSVVAAGDAVKGNAAILFCELYFMENDEKFFGVYYDRAKKEIETSLRSYDATERAQAELTAVALDGMKLAISGDENGACELLCGHSLQGVLPLSVLHHKALCEFIRSKNAEKQNETRCIRS